MLSSGSRTKSSCTQSPQCRDPVGRRTHALNHARWEIQIKSKQFGNTNTAVVVKVVVQSELFIQVFRLSFTMLIRIVKGSEVQKE